MKGRWGQRVCVGGKRGGETTEKGGGGVWEKKRRLLEGGRGQSWHGMGNPKKQKKGLRTTVT